MKWFLVHSMVCIALFGSAQSWSSAGTYTGIASTMGVFNNEIYLGALDTMPDLPPTNILFKYSSGVWNAITGTASYYKSAGDELRAIQEYNGDLYIGGNFATLAGTTMQYNLVKLSGSSCSQLASGLDMNATIIDMTVWNNKLCVTGVIEKAGGIDVHHVATWDGSNWAELGSGLGDYATSLTSFGGKLYAAGNFTSAGGGTAHGIAKWDGSTWSDAGIPSKAISFAYCLKEYKNELYAGGYFILDTNNSTPSAVIKWDGSKWAPVGMGVGISFINTMEVYNDELYVAGSGTTTNGAVVNGIARWNGHAWSGLGSGITANNDEAYVMGLLARPEGLYVCGSFTSAGGQPIANVAIWNMPTGLAETDPGDEVTLYPNPATYKVNVKGISPESASVQIFDLTGRGVLECSIEKNAINIASLPNGLYELQLKTNDGVVNKRLLVNR